MVSVGCGALDPVYLHTQLFLHWKHLQYVVIIINANIIVVNMGVPIVESNLTSVDDQKVGKNDLSLVKVLFMLKTDMCFISCILLAKLFKFSSVMIDISRDCFKLKLLILE